MRLVTPDQQKAQRAIAESKPKRRQSQSPGAYLVLGCGHFTSTAVQEVYRVWRSSPELYLCEICGVEVSGRKSASLPAQDDKPPF